MVIAVQGQGAALLEDGQIHLPPASGGHWPGRAVLQGEDLIELRDLARLFPGEGEAPRSRGSHRLWRAQFRIAHLRRQLPAGQPAGHPQEVFPLHGGLDLDGHGQSEALAEDAGAAWGEAHVLPAALHLQAVGHCGGGLCRGSVLFRDFGLRWSRVPGAGLRPGQLHGTVPVHADADIPPGEAGADSAGYVKVSGCQNRQREGGGSGQNPYSLHSNRILHGSEWGLPGTIINVPGCGTRQNTA